MEKKSFEFKVKDMLGEKGIFTGHAAVFGNEDLHGEVIDSGAFKRTLQHNGGRVKILFNHRIDQPIGVAKVKEDQKGLYVEEGRISLGVKQGQETYELIKDGVIDSLSFGFDTLRDAVIGKVRHIQEVRLWEVSPVVFPANPSAQIESVKSVVPFQDLALADQARPWDAGAALKRVRDWAGAEDGPNAKYRRAFVWYDPENEDVFSAYKLPIADVIDGELRAVPRGVFAAAGVVAGARGGANIPDADMAGVRSHLARYYRKLDLTAPWEKSLTVLRDFRALLGGEKKGDSANVHSLELKEQLKSINQIIRGGI